MKKTAEKNRFLATIKKLMFTTKQKNGLIFILISFCDNSFKSDGISGNEVSANFKIQRNEDSRTGIVNRFDV